MMVHELVRELDERDIHLYVQDGKLRCKAPPDALTPEIQSTLALRKEEIIKQLTKGLLLDTPPINPVPRNGPLPLSFAQGRLWFLDQLNASQSAAYHLVFAARMTGDIDFGAFNLSLKEVVSRHEILRTVFQVHDEQPAQVILPEIALNITVTDLSDLSINHRDDELQRLITDEAQLPFDLSRGPLIRTRLFKLATNGTAEHVLSLIFHHIVFDGWSMDILLREFLAIYEAVCEGRPSSLPKLPIQYADYAVWQQAWLQGEVLERQLSYWKEQLAGAPEVLALPTGRPRPAVQSYRGASYAFTLSAELTAQLHALSKREGVTLFMTLLAGFQVLLSRYSGQRDICVGSPIANRNRVEIEGLIGFFVNTLVLRTDLSGNPTFTELLTRVREVCLGAQAHQDTPFEKLVEELQPVRDMSHSPLFQVMFTFQSNLPSEFDVAGVQVSPIQINTRSAMFDMSLHMAETESGLLAAFEYSSDLFEHGSIIRLAEHLQVLLAGIVAHSESRLSELPLLSESEHHQLLNEWNATEADYPKDKCIHELFEAQVECSPETIAVVYEDQQLTYAELNAKANQLAHHLRALGIGPDTLVGICVERSLEMVVSILGILKAGGAYLPLDPAYPKERLGYMLEDAKPAVVLTQARLREALPEHPNKLCLDADWAVIVRRRKKNVPNVASPLNLAYVIYTSGSTGRPKGVSMTHQNVPRLFAATETEYRFDASDVWTLFHSYAFDFSVWELWGALLYGGRAVVVPYWVSRSPEALHQLLNEQRVTVLNQTPSSFYQLDDIDAALNDGLSLRLIIFGGEALEPRRLRGWFTRHGDASPRLVNMYGITETTVHVTARTLGLADTEELASSGIGRPLPDLQAYLLDAQGTPVPIGVPGELHVGGAGLARGYLNRPGLSAERFIPNPFSNQPGERLYRTGDLARYRPDGSIEYLGRIDHQVKVHGFRIELGEIEARLREHPEVREALVIAREDTPGDKRLVAYVVGKANGAMPAYGIYDVSALRTHLIETLPDYMVPAAFVLLEALPLTPNGKVDRKTLPAPDIEGQLVQQYVAPRNATEELLATIWAEVLGVKRVGIHDNFFELGGHSLLAVTMIERLRRQRLAVDVRALFITPTVAGLADQVGCEQVIDIPPNRIAPDCTAITPELLPLVTLSQAEIDGIAAQVPGGVKNIQDIYPLAPLQEGILFHHLIETEGDVYLLPSLLGFDTRARLDGFLEALQSVVDRHDIMRTAVIWEGLPEPVEVVWREAPLVIEEVTLEGEGDKAAELRAGFNPRHYRLDIRQAPLLRGFVAEESPSGRWLLLLLSHHLVLDHTALELLVDEVRAHVLGRSAELPAPLPFRNFVAQARLGVSRAEHEAFFREMLGDVDVPTAPFGLVDVQGNASAIEEGRLELEAGLARRLRACARHLGVSAASLCHLAWALVLGRVSGQDDVVFGTVLFGRMQGGEGSDRVLGMFINTLPVRIRLGSEGVAAAVHRMHALLADVLRHEHASLALAQRCSAVPLPTPIFSALFNYRYSQTEDAKAEAELAWEGIEMLESEERTNYPVTLSVDDLEEGFQLTAQVQSPIAPERLCSYMQTALVHLVEALEMTPELAVRAIEVLPESEWHQLLIEWNDTQTEYPQEQCIHELFEAQSERSPEATAVMYEEQQLTYRELNSKANQLARHLRTLGVGPDTLVGIYVERSLEMVIGILGILKAGGAYLPLDPAYPKERLVYMLEDARPQVLLTQGRLRDALPEQSKILCLDTDWAVIAQRSEKILPNLASPLNLAYVIFTSGSTGKPKGVMISHRNVVHSTQARFKHYQGVVDGFLLLSPVAFDSSIAGIFWTMSSGGRLRISPEGIQHDLFALSTLITEDRRISHLLCLPSLYSLLLEQLSVKHPGRLRTVIVAGEACPCELADRHHWLLGDIELHNEYGPTEGTVWSSVYQVQSRKSHTSVPIGRPISNVRIYLLGGELDPVPIGATGELYIAGEGLARGYLNRSDLTAERFLPDPFWGSGRRMYRSGDLARYREDGNIEYVGRIDHQVKIRGFRIELGEIEARLLEDPEVSEAVVAPWRVRAGKDQLVAYVVGRKAAPNAEALRARLKVALPEYMVPAAFVYLDALPLTPNGKVDRRALPDPDITTQLTCAHITPRNAIEDILARIWCEVLGVERVSVEDNFFALGGDSILTIQVVSRARQKGLTIKPRDLFQYQTISEIATLVDTAPIPHAEQGLVVGCVPLTPVQQWFFEQHLPNPHYWNQAVLLEAKSLIDTRALEAIIEHLQWHHDALRLRFVSEAEGWRQTCVGDCVTGIFQYVKLSKVSADAIKSEAAKWQASLDLSKGPLWRVVWFDLGAGRLGRLLIIIHHLAVDGVSWRVLLEDLQTGYWQAARGEPIVLPPKTTSFKNWSERLHEFIARDVLDEEVEYWSELACARVKPLLVEDPQGANTEALTEVVRVALSDVATKALLREIPKTNGAQINEVLLAALAQTLCAWNNTDSLLIDLEGHGREELFQGVDLSRTVGWFTSLFPVLLRIAANAPAGEIIESVKRQLRGVPHSGVGYGLLRYLGSKDVAARLDSPRCVDVSFNYLGQFDQVFPELSLFAPVEGATGLEHDPQGERGHELDIHAYVIANKLQIVWSYSQARYRRATIEALAEAYARALNSLVRYCVSQARSEGPTNQNMSTAGFAISRDDYSVQKMPTTYSSDGTYRAAKTTTIDLESEATLEEAIAPKPNAAVSGVKPSSVLLTGATGFLGAFLINELIRGSDATIYCLVRASTVAEAASKLRHNLNKYLLWDPSISARVIPLCGDLSKPRLGLSEVHFQSLVTRIDVIYHNGALINLAQPYGTLKSANVSGTVEILRLACLEKAKPVHYVSTLSVFGDEADPGPTGFLESDYPNPHAGLRSGYAQSKWVAEQLVRIAGTRGLPVNIYRPGTISGHSHTGVWNTEDLFCRMVKACVELRKAPDHDELMHLVPVDYVAKAIVYLSQERALNGRTFHLTNPNPPTIRDLIEWIDAYGYPIQRIPLALWRGEVSEFLMRTKNDALSSLVAALPEEIATLPPPDRYTYSCRKTLEALAPGRITFPIVDMDVFNSYLSWFVNNELIDAP